MFEDRVQQDDIHVGIIFSTLHSENGCVAWCFREYDPNDKENFPVAMHFKQAGELVTPQNPGRVLDVQNDDGLTVFLDREYRHPILKRMVSLDYEIGKVSDTEKHGEQVQMIGGNRVHGIPTNVDPEVWCEYFFEARPALLFRPRAVPVTP